MKQRYKTTLETLDHLIRSSKTAGASQALQRLARLKARNMRSDLQSHFIEKGRCRDGENHLELSSCGLIADIDALDNSVSSFSLWLDKAIKVEAETGKLIQLDEEVDLKIEDADDEEVQKQITDIKQQFQSFKSHEGKAGGKRTRERLLLLNAQRKGDKQATADHLRRLRALGNLSATRDPDGQFITCPRCS